MRIRGRCRIWIVTFNKVAIRFDSFNPLDARTRMISGVSKYNDIVDFEGLSLIRLDLDGLPVFEGWPHAVAVYDYSK